MVFEFINAILNIIYKLTYLPHPNLNLLAMFISLSKILKEDHHAFCSSFKYCSSTWTPPRS
jgi:hypothetical protein